MKPPLHILHLEDELNDAALVQSALEGEGVACSITRVQNQEEFLAALRNGGIDLVLSDYSLPGFDGLSALEIAHAEQPQLPVIMVSGTLGEELAIDALKKGATDYVLKERLGRLASAVRRAMQEVEERAERRRLEAQVIEAQKMEVIGQLAGGVAHDFNNILSVIIGYSDLILQKLGSRNRLRQDVEEIRHASQRAAGLTRQLLVFSRRQTVRPVVLNLNDVMKDMDKMLRRLIGENIEMVVIPEKRSGRVNADPGYVGQVLMNLVVNARDAMPHGGKLTITTKFANFDDSFVPAPDGMTSGHYVMLSVCDTGSGMTDDVKARMFEAFFTTKPKGEGTGLGLSTCQTIVQQSGGHIEVISELGEGTTFNVYFPRVEQPLDVAARPIPPGPLPRGTETVLVVEDEPAVRHLALNVLQSQGYEVLSSSNGQAALNIVRDHKGSPIRLVVTDVIMPVMGGKAMAEWLETAYPDIKVLFTSGYTDDAIAQDGVLKSDVAFLAKPYTPAALIHKVRSTLDNGFREEPDDAKYHASREVLNG
jgi:two-component system cell cycle sensor histidine kinase/response regulator CckA